MGPGKKWLHLSVLLKLSKIYKTKRLLNLQYDNDNKVAYMIPWKMFLFNGK